MKKLKLFESFYPLDKVTVRELIQDIIDEYDCEVILNEYGGPETSIDQGIRLDLYWKYTYPNSFGQEIMDEIINKLEDCDYEVNTWFCYPRGRHEKFKSEYSTMGMMSSTLAIYEK